MTYRPPSVDALYLQVSSVINVLLPIVFGAGVAGNALNAFLLTRRRAPSTDGGGGGGGHGRPTTFERSAMAGLVALSASDFLFCLVGFAEVLRTVLFGITEIIDVKNAGEKNLRKGVQTQ